MGHAARLLIALQRYLLARSLIHRRGHTLGLPRQMLLAFLLLLLALVVAVVAAAALAAVVVV